jgi:hypothetical protein
MARYSQWDEAKELKEIAVEIRELRAEFGQPNSQVDEFLRLSVRCAARTYPVNPSYVLDLFGRPPR